MRKATQSCDSCQRLCRLLAGIAALVICLPVFAQVAASPWPVRLHHDLARIGRLEWRLREAAGSACPSKASDIGIILDARSAYQPRDWPLLEATVGLRELPVIVDLVPKGPGADAGLKAGDEILAINGIAVDTIAAKRGAQSLIADALLAEIAESDGGSVIAFKVRRAGQDMMVSVQPVRHCGIRLVLFTDQSIEAYSDQRNVALSSGIVTYAQTDDELALVAGHEFAHVIHRDRRGGGISVRRLLEDRADEVGLSLAECAGYDRNAGLAIFERLRRRDPLGLMRARTHRAWSERIARLRAQRSPPACPIV